MTPELIPTALEAGNVDVAEMSPLFFGDHQNPTNYIYLSELIGDYNYVAFRLGHWDFDENRNVYDPNRKMANANLRRAMAFAVDEEVLTSTLYHGLRFPAVTNSPAHHRALLDPTVPGFPYNPQMAMQLLDEAGFIDVDGDGFREDPNGEQFTVILAYPTGPEEEIIVAFYLQSWAAVGLRVELWQGRTHDIFYLWDVLDFDADDDEIDIYMGAWSPGADPNPGGSWGHAMWNPSRYTSPEYDAILDRMLTPAALEEAYMLQVFSDWQWYWYNNAPYFPTQQRIGLWAINNRVTNWDNRNGISPRTFGWHTVGLSAAEPYSR
jgi:peptide/nickel transport system substrate-binding protein